MQHITVNQMHDIYQANPDAQFIDVRDADEHAEVHATGVRLMPLSEFTTHAQDLNLDEPIYLICRSGGRSQQAGQYLEAAGADQVFNVDGGTTEWVEQNLPTG